MPYAYRMLGLFRVLTLIITGIGAWLYHEPKVFEVILITGFVFYVVLEFYLALKGKE